MQHAIRQYGLKVLDQPNLISEGILSPSPSPLCLRSYMVFIKPTPATAQGTIPALW